ncbi:hypothetical protein AZE42_10212 [Rhizopogon vesiculosus]|uniref:Uncharacterized protein n=1 Tax=Rhizopogon vesiculosus TaxID=180088 RepID=A0A1J8Q7Z4_9AGAM|nr:hypothetical protein AZE42_10212 [Rhizopogon vesiculosus]
MAVIQNTKQVFSTRGLLAMQPHALADDQRMEYNQLLEQVYKMTREIEGKLPMYYIILRSDDVIRKLVAIVLTVAHQRNRCSNGSPQYIIGLHTLKSMYMQVQKANEEFEQRFQMMKAAVGSQQMGGPHINRPPPHTAPNVPPPAQHTSPQTLQLPQIGPPISRHPSANQSHPSQHPSANMSQPSHPPPPQPMVKKAPTRVPPSPSIPAATAIVKVPSPTPPPASTAPTPATAASPQTPKSPKSKQPSKAKNGQRTPKPPTASPSEHSPTFTPGVKRPADEDVSTLPTAGPSTQPESFGAPSPKKVKTEDWEEEPSEAFVNRHQEVDSIKTEEETIAFLDRMKELVAISASTDTGVYDDITHTLERILQGASQDPTNIATPAFASSIGPPLSELSPPAGPPNDAFSEFHEFIDFSSFTTLEDEEETKAPTPDLVSSSSTNPSPQSNPDADQSHQGASSPDKTKVEEPRESNHLDLLHIGAFKEIDGGESAYYQPPDWKWEGPMTTLDPAWAIYQTS